MKKLFYLLLIPFVAAAQLSPISVPNMATLRTIVPNTPKPVFVEGYYAPGDGGGGWYSVTNTTGGTNAYGGRVLALGGAKSWELIDLRPNIRQFGAKGDNATDDTASFQELLDWAGAQTTQPAVYIPAGNYIIASVTNTIPVDIYGMTATERAITKGAATLRHKAGETNDMLIIRPGVTTSQGPLSCTISGISFYGKSETNLRNPVLITAISSGNRLEFYVDPASVPTYTPDPQQPWYGFVGFFNETNRWMGSGMLKTVNTTNGLCTLEPGTDSFATPLGGTDLIVGWKVTFPKVTTVTNFNNTFTVSKFSSAAANPSAIRADAVKGLIVRDCSFVQWWCGLASYVEDTQTVDDCEFVSCRYSAASTGNTGFGSDSKVSVVQVNAYYTPDDGQNSIASLVENPAYLGGAIGWDLLGSQVFIDHLVLSRCIYGIAAGSLVNGYIGDGLFEGCVREPIWMFRGNSGFDMGPLSIQRMRVLTNPTYDVPSNRGSVPVIRLTGTYSRLDVNLLTIAPFNTVSVATNWGWNYLYEVQNATSNQLTLGRYVARGNYVTNITSGSSLKARSVFPSSVVSTVNDAQTSGFTWERPGVPSFGTLQSTYLQFGEDYDSDGDFDVAFGYLRAASTAEILFGAQNGENPPPGSVIRGAAATGTDVSGGALTIHPGKGTGAATESSLAFQLPVKTASGTTAQTNATVLTIQRTPTPALDETALVLVYYDGTNWVTAGRVSRGTADSGGVGKRALTVPN